MRSKEEIHTGDCPQRFIGAEGECTCHESTRPQNVEAKVVELSMEQAETLMPIVVTGNEGWAVEVMSAMNHNAGQPCKVLRFAHPSGGFVFQIVLDVNTAEGVAESLARPYVETVAPVVHLPTGVERV